MKHIYQAEGITCMGCVAKVEKALSGLEGINNVKVTLDPPAAELEMAHHVELDVLNAALKGAGNYSLKNGAEVHHSEHNTEVAEFSWLRTYRPLLIVLGYLFGGVALHQLVLNDWNMAIAMRDFMGGFFIAFSFFKMLDIKGFALSYSSYDMVAKRWMAYGYVYPFIELGLGIAYLTGINLLLTNAITLVVMSVSIIGVLQSVMNKRKIQCACLGTVFNLPMSTVTIMEDGAMIAMAAAMLGMS